jgi:hypothetical protein
MGITMSTNTAPDSHTAIVIREATDSDRVALNRLAQLDSARVPTEPLIVAEIGGELRAAVSIGDGSAIADPFHRTAELVALADLHASQRRHHVRRRLRVVGRSPSARVVPPHLVRQDAA